MLPLSTPKKRVPLGEPLQLTEQQLNDLSQVTPADIARAQIFWRANAPQGFESLLDAKTVEEDPDQPQEKP